MQEGDDCMGCGGEVQKRWEKPDGRKRFKCPDCGWGWTDWTEKHRREGIL